MRLRLFVASLYAHMCTNFGWFTLIFSKMALIVLAVLSILLFQVLSFTKSNCRDFIANDEWPPVHPTSIHWIIRFEGNAGLESYHKLQLKPKTKQFPSLKMQFDLVCLTGESHWQYCEKLLQATAGMCVSQRWTFWTNYVTIHTNRYI